jgi:hypothetical protein
VQCSQNASTLSCTWADVCMSDMPATPHSPCTDKPIHCVVWAKDLLFARLFGRPDEVTGGWGQGAHVGCILFLQGWCSTVAACWMVHTQQVQQDPALSTDIVMQCTDTFS